MAVGLVGAVSTVYMVSSTGRPLVVAVAAGIIAYAVIRWLIAWDFRVRYWHRRGTKGHYSRSCPECGQYIYRQSGDWILTCKRCGWTAGLPLVRWVTQSVPARQFRRTVAGPKLVIVILAVVVIAAGGGAALSAPGNATNGFDVLTVSTPLSNEEGGTAAPVSSGDRAATTPTDPPAGGVDLKAAETAILERTNAIRNERELSTLSRDTCLDEYALQHSRDMAEYGYAIRHGGPDGQSWADRAQRIQSECGGPVSENIHSAPSDGEVYIYGTDETIRLSTPSNLAEFAVRGWMNSQGHRENMLDARWTELGVGVATNGEKFYFTIIFS